MSRPFWFAAVSGTLFASLVINQFALNRTEAATILAVLIWTLLMLAVIEVFLVGPPKGPTPRNP